MQGRRMICGARGWLLLVAFAVCGTGGVYGQNFQEIFDPDVREFDGWELEREIPLDPSITFGVLDNGLTYYVKPNERPENTAALRLGIKVGSVQEADNQSGLARFVQHMAFEGTSFFQKSELRQFLESIGMRFGPDVSSYTSFERTVYELSIPLDDPLIAEQAMLILREWAAGIAFNPDEIERVRAKLVDERRSGGGADARLRDKQYPLLFAGSRYADRSPLGDVDAIQGFVQEDLVSFYNDWYRPELMSVVAVGDFDAEWMAGLVKKYFGNLQNPEGAPAHRFYPVPTNEQPLISVDQDPEATVSTVSLYYKHPPTPEITVGDYRLMIIQRLHNMMLNQRLQEAAQRADPPFLYAGSSYDVPIRTKGLYSISAVVPQGGTRRGIDALTTEAERLLEHGFTGSELARAKAQLLQFIASLNRERDTSESALFADEYLRNFFEAEFVPGIEVEYELHEMYLPGISVAEVDRLSREWISDVGRVVIVNGPQKADVSYPSEDEILAVMEAAAGRKTTGYVDDVVDRPLVDEVPEQGGVVAERVYKEFEVLEWTLSNGIRVFVKPTEYQVDEVKFSAFSPGGTSRADDDQYVPASTAASVVVESGVGDFSASQLDKLLAGKRVSVTPYIDTLTEGLTGSASPGNLEALFQLIYLYVTAPGRSSAAFQSLKTRLRTLAENRSSDPDSVFSEIRQRMLRGDGVRFRPLSVEDLELMDLDESLRFYKERFSDLGDATFVFVGNIDVEVLREHVKTYLASLPSRGRTEAWRTVEPEFPETRKERTVRMGGGPAATVALSFPGEYRWSLQDNLVLDVIVNMLRIRLRDVLREDLAGSYGVAVWADTDKYPEGSYVLNISYSVDPASVDASVRSVLQELDWLTFIAEEDLVVRVREGLRRRHETDLKSNDFWLQALRDAAFHAVPLEEKLAYADRLDGVTPSVVEETARRIIGFDRYVKVVLVPAEDNDE